MKISTSLFFMLLTAALYRVGHASSLEGFVGCDLVKWRDLSHEAFVLKDHPGIARREEHSLKIALENGKTMDFEDSHSGEEAAGAYEIHRVIGVGAQNEWVALFEPGSESFGYRLIHRKSGQVEELGGCPLWSPDGHFLAAIHEDLESGKTRNEASLWFCPHPSDGCKKIWSEPFGGEYVRWTQGAVELVLSKLDPSTKDYPKLQKTVLCKPLGGKPNCRDMHTWEKANRK